MQLAELVEASKAIAETRAKNAKIEHLAGVLGRLSTQEAAVGAAWLSGEIPQGRFGIGWAAVRDMDAIPAAVEATLAIGEVDEELAAIASAAGSGSGQERKRRLAALFARATTEERDFLRRLLLGDLRQGALEGLMVVAVAKASGIECARVRRAAMLAGSVTVVAAAALRDGAHGLDAFELKVMRPVLPMLAQPGEDVADALAQLGEAALELKLDGARIQAHKAGDEVRVFTRSLQDVTVAVPEVVELVRALPARELVLDGEAIALRADGSPLPFQTTMRRFGRRLEVERMRAELPLMSSFFDCILLDGAPLIDAPARERFVVLERIVPEAHRVLRVVTGDVARGEELFRRVVAEGHEGLMAKALGAPYAAGSRGSAWVKIKPAHTLDLVVLAAEWGSGRRRGWLSNLHLGARDPKVGGFVMLGKTFKGMTDAMLASQTQTLLGLEMAREEHVVHVRPELVVEIAFNDVQASPRYPGGMALRFARVKRYRTDKRADEADTIDAVRAIFARSSRS
jgi:DNA ligase-1